MIFNKLSTRIKVLTKAAVIKIGEHLMFLDKNNIQLKVNKFLYDMSVIILLIVSA